MSLKMSSVYSSLIVVCFVTLFSYTNSAPTENAAIGENVAFQKYPSQWPHSSEHFWNTFKDRVFVLRPYNSRLNPFNRKRSCFINAGMTNNCDFKDLISAASARRIWQSPNLSPGKRSVPVKSLIGDQESNINELKIQDYDLPSEHVQAKRMQCISGLPGGDCENSFLGAESMGQDFLRPGGRNPGRR